MSTVQIKNVIEPLNEPCEGRDLHVDKQLTLHTCVFEYISAARYSSMSDLTQSDH